MRDPSQTTPGRAKSGRGGNFPHGLCTAVADIGKNRTWCGGGRRMRDFRLCLRAPFQPRDFWGKVPSSFLKNHIVRETISEKYCSVRSGCVGWPCELGWWWWWICLQAAYARKQNLRQSLPIGNHNNPDGGWYVFFGFSKSQKEIKLELSVLVSYSDVRAITVLQSCLAIF